jgi:hypothetical protein
MLIRMMLILSFTLSVSRCEASTLGAVLSKQELAERVMSLRRPMQLFHVDATFVMLHPPPDTIAFDHQSIWINQNRFRLEHAYGVSPSVQLLVQVTNNESGMFVFHTNPPYATFTSHPSPEEVKEVVPTDNGFFEFLLFDPFAEYTHTTNPFDLVELLKSETSRVRLKLEQHANFTCHVVDVFQNNESIPYMSIWLDADHSALPILLQMHDTYSPPPPMYMPARQRASSPRVCGRKMTSTHIGYEREITAISEVATGVWLPTKAARRVLSMDYEYTLTVDVRDNVTPCIEIGKVFDAAKFDLSNELPAKVSVVNIQSESRTSPSHR